MERLGRLSGVLLHASVLKRLELNCPGEVGGKRAQDPGAELERDVQKMPEDFQAAFSLQLGATHKLGDFIVRDLLKKSGGCATVPCGRRGPRRRTGSSRRCATGARAEPRASAPVIQPCRALSRPALRLCAMTAR